MSKKTGEQKQSGIGRVLGWLGIGNDNTSQNAAPSGRQFGGFADDVKQYQTEGYQQREAERRQREEEERRRKEEEERRREQAAAAYQDEQNAVLAASKERERQKAQQANAAAARRAEAEKAAREYQKEQDAIRQGPKSNKKIATSVADIQRQQAESAQAALTQTPVNPYSKPDPKKEWERGNILSNLGISGDGKEARAEGKETLKARHDALQEEYNTLDDRVTHAQIGEDYTPEDYDRDVARMAELEPQLAEYTRQIGLLQEDVDPVEALGTNAYAGLEAAGLGLTKTLDWLMGENSIPWRAAQGIGNFLGFDTSNDVNPITAMKNRGQQEVAYWQNRGNEADEGNDTWETIGRHTQSIAQSAPFVVLNLLTAGGAGATTKGLEYAAKLGNSSGLKAIGAMAGHGMQTLASNPAAQYSFASTFGDNYDSAIAEGASPAEATLYAVLNSTYNAMIEVGGADEAAGGMEALPKSVQKALAGGDIDPVMEYIKSIFGEISEEEFQGIMERGLKSVYTDVPLYSATDENAVINPRVMAETARDTAIDTAVMGGAQTALQYAGNRLAQPVPDSGTGTAQGVDRAMEMLGMAQENAQPVQPAPSLAGESQMVPDSGTGSAAAQTIDALTNPATETQEGQILPQSEEQSQGDIPAPPTAEETTTAAPGALNSGEQTGAAMEPTEEPEIPAPLPPKPVRDAALELIGNTGSAVNRQSVQEGLQEIADYIQSNNNGQGIDEDTLHSMAQNVAVGILNEIPGEQTGDAGVYNALRNFLAGRNIQISDELRGDVTDYASWLRSMFGKMNLRNSGTAIDTLYQELGSAFGEGLFPQDISSHADQINRIADVLESTRPQSTYWVDSMTEADYYEALSELTQDVLEQAQAIGSNASAISYENLLSLDENAPPEMVPRGTPETGMATPTAEPRRLISRPLPQQTNNTQEMAQQMSQGEAAPGSDVYDVLGQANGTIAPGENAARESNMPRGVNNDERVSAAARTVYEAQATPDNRLTNIRDAVVDGQFAYVPTTNNSVTQKAEQDLERNGWDDTYIQWKQDIAAGKANEDMVATGAVLLNNAGNSTMSGRAYVDLVSDYSELLHRLGRGLAAGRILKSLSPEGRLYGIQRTVQKMNEAIRSTRSTVTQTANENANTGSSALTETTSTASDNRQAAVADNEIQIPEELIESYLQQTTDEGRDTVITEMQKSIAQQIKPTFMEKLTAFRYTAMLGNFKTQGRNLLGNTLMTVMRMTKDRTAALLEAFAYAASGGTTERSKSIWAGSDLYKAANDDYVNVKDVAEGEAKYGENKRFEKGIEDYRTIFKNRVLERWRKATQWAMTQGDNIFIRFNYADALAGWLRAHNITAEQWSQMVNDPFERETVDRARQYAIQQAQEATFHDDNAVSRWASRVGRGNTDSAMGKVVQTFTEGIIPFRKTPANVAVRAFEYSPVGILETGYKVMQRATGKANVSSAEIFDSLSKNLTGTGLAILGYLMAASGHARGKDDDDKQEAFDKLRGEQDYSVNWNGKSFTMDWASPAAIPFFMGVQLNEEAGEQGISPETVIHALQSMTDPMLEMSMLSGVNDALGCLGNYGEDTEALPLFLENALSSFVSQFAPTLFGQLEQLGEDYRRTSYTTNGVIPRTVQRQISKVSSKIPLNWDFQQIDYIDAWGRRQETQTGLGRAFEALLSPGYSWTDRSTPVDDELQRLYDAGMENVLPVRPEMSTKVNGTKLSPEEYETFAVTRGQTALDLVTDFVQSKEYRRLDDKQRADIISNLYSLATDTAKLETARNRKEAYKSDWDKTQTVLDTGVDPVDYLLGRKTANADGKNALKVGELFDWLSGSKYTEKQKAAIWDANYTGDKSWSEYSDSHPITILTHAGLSRNKASTMYNKIDTNGNGITQKEIMAYYKNHKGDAKYLEALWKASYPKTKWPG